MPLSEVLLFACDEVVEIGYEDEAGVAEIIEIDMAEGAESDGVLEGSDEVCWEEAAILKFLDLSAVNGHRRSDEM